MEGTRHLGARPYPAAWNLVLFLGGLVDPLLGVFGKIVSLFWQPKLPALADRPRRRRRGLVLVLGGIEGPSQYNYSMALGALRSGYRGAVVRFPWNAGIFGLRSLINLMSRRHHERQSDLLVASILDHNQRYPGSPVCLLAQSGGCWIALRALEKLPDSSPIHSAVLLAPSISPARDLSIAAARCRFGLYSIGGPGDFFFLGLCTTLFGTSDRVYTPSSGLVGWHHHPRGFIECRWHPDWVRYGYLGNHTSSSSASFIQHVVAPLFEGRRGLTGRHDAH